MDLEARTRWVDYSRAKDAMFENTDIEEARWWVVEADEKKRARLNCIRQVLDNVPYTEIESRPITLPPRQPDTGYERPPFASQCMVPNFYE